MTPADYCRAAAKLVDGERNGTYGDAYEQHKTAAGLWNAYIAGKGGEPLNAADICHLMVLLKMSRVLTGGFHEDASVDGAGYMGCAGYCAEREAGEFISNEE